MIQYLLLLCGKGFFGSPKPILFLGRHNESVILYFPNYRQTIDNSYLHNNEPRKPNPPSETTIRPPTYPFPQTPTTAHSNAPAKRPAPSPRPPPPPLIPPKGGTQIGGRFASELKRPSHFCSHLDHQACHVKSDASQNDQ
jgi:hypothetical protein